MLWHQFRDIINDKINEKNFIISQTNDDVKWLNKKIKISMNDIKDDEPKESFQHLIFFGIMMFENDNGSTEIKDICIKFEKTKYPSYGTYNQKSTSYVMYNYNKVIEYLNKFPKRDMVKINDVYCCETDDSDKSICLWIEARLDNFSVFNDTERHSYIEQLLTTDIDILKAFQIFIYNESGYEHTIIDLQGGIVDGIYVLCDIEFTTNNLYEFTSPMMLDTITTLYNLEKFNLGTVVNRLTEIENGLTEIRNGLTEIRNEVKDMKGMLEQILHKLS